MRQLYGPILFLTLLGCRGSTPAEVESLSCPPVTGEFPPDGCARVQGTLEVVAPSSPSQYFVAVDTTDPITRQWFSAAAQRVAADGRFALLVIQLSPLGSLPVTEPSVRTLEIRVFQESDDFRRRENARSATLVPMNFGRWGGVVTNTPATLRLTTP